MSSAAERRQALARDVEARRAAQTRFDRPIVLEAGAGTGKTTTLVARTVLWSLGPGWNRQNAAAAEAGRPLASERLAAAVLDSVVAITFTEAAAAEMATRVAAAFAAIAAGREGELRGLDLDLLEPELSDDERRLRARALLGALDHLTVRTIHAFCRSLLASYPLEAGIHPDLTVDADGSQTEEVIRGEVEREVRRAYAAEGEHPLLTLAGRGIGPRRIAECLGKLVVEKGLPAAALAAPQFDEASVGATFARLADRLDALRTAGGDRLRGIAQGKKGIWVAEALEATGRRLTEIRPGGIDSVLELQAALAAIWTPKHRKTLGEYRRDQLSQSERAVVGEDLERFREAAGEMRRAVEHYLSLRPRELETIRSALHPLLLAVEQEMRRRGVLTFPGLLRQARDLLAARPRVRARERRRIALLLVDEFQDTDRLQCELVRLLALDGPPAERPSLFIVGDPKQTIYGWRDADLEAYEAFVSDALAAGGERHYLLQNFRSAETILDEVNRVVEPVMREEPGLQPPYEPLVPCDEHAGDRGFSRAGRKAVEYWVSWAVGGDGEANPATPAEVACTLEARAAAADIAALHRDEGVPWGAIAILLRVTTQQETYLQALRAAGVPFAVSRDRSYFRRREIIDAAALVRTVVNPTDQQALLTWLRSPGVGVPDAAWIPLWRRGFPKLVMELSAPSRQRLDKLAKAVREAAGELPPGIPGLEQIAGWEENLLDALDTLGRLRRAFAEQPTDRFVDAVRRQALLDCCEAARFLGEFRIANLDRFFRQLTASLDERGDVQSVLRAVRRGVSEAREAEQALPKEMVEDAVQVFTIHGAKGLEFDHLYLLHAHAARRSDDGGALDADERWEPGRRAEYRLFGCATPGFDTVAARRQAVERAERVRTLYVALTRARRRLVVGGLWRLEGRGRSGGSHVQLLEPRGALAGPLSGQPPPMDGPGACSDRLGAGWRFLGHSEAGGAAPARPRPALATPAAADVRRAARALARLRREARDRQGHPRLAAASSETGERLASLLEVDGGSEPRGARDLALAVGDALHRLLEEWDLTDDPERQLAIRRREMTERLERSLPRERAAAARERAERLLDRFVGGTLWGRFLGIAPHVLAREMPLILPVAAHSPAEGPLTAWTGAIDLLYRDPESGAPVIVDFKTDEVTGDEAIGERAGAYARQEAVYREAVRSALGLDRDPAFELWFLAADRLWQAP